jgi:HK97 family phage major capsid protein
MTNENTDLTKSVETALVAFNEYKGMVEGFDKKLKDISPKLDALDLAKFDKLAKDMGDGIEASQKALAQAKAAEEKQKELEASNKELAAQYKALEIAFNRVPTGGSSDEKAKELATLRTKAFNSFARTKGKEDFADYLAKLADDQPELKALAVGSDPNGGYLVMPEFGGIIQNRVFESSPIRMLATVTPIGSDALELVQDNDEASCGWVSEAGSRDTTNTPTLGKLNFPAEELYAKPKVTQKMLDDSSIDIESWLMQKVADIFARTEATAFVSGSGTGKPRGLLSYTAGTTITSGQIEQVVTGSATTFTYDGLVDLQNALKEPYQPNAVFLIRRASNAHLLKIKDGEGRPIFNMSYDKNAGLQPTIMGKSVYFASDMPAVTGSALAMAYGDIREAYQIVDRRGISVLRDPYSSKPYVEFYTTKRVGGGVKNFEAVKIGKIST